MNIRKTISILCASVLAVSMPLAAHAEEQTYPSDSDDYKALVSEYPEYYRIQGDSVYFLEHSLMGETDFVISSDALSTVEYVDFGYVFTPEEDGRYVIVLEETIQDCVGDDELFAMIEYKNKHAYIADVENGEISVSYEGSSDGSTSFDDTPCAEDSLYFSFVNGVLPDYYNRYITTVYGYNRVSSYFCLNSEYLENLYNTDVTTSDNTVAYCCRQMGVAGSLTTDDILALSIVRAVADGEAVITLNDDWQFYVTVENGIFRRAEEMTVLPEVLQLSGDVNADSKFSVTDIIMLQKYLLCTGNLTAPQNADMCADGTLDAFDLAVMKRELLRRNQSAEPMLVVVDDRIYDYPGWTTKTFVEVLDSDGYWHVQESDTHSWEMVIADVLTDASEMIETVTPSDQLTDAERDETQTFLENAAQYEGTEMTAWEDFGIADYGQENLYAVYPDGNGGYRAVELCRFGDECAWLDNAEIQEFVTMLIENGYYADKLIFHNYLEWLHRVV